jgi:pimeloyl-ACP methyl ester carboxylesterase
MTLLEHDRLIVPLTNCDAELETLWISPERKSEVLLVFLHEGLGSIAAWRGWPEALCSTLDCRGFVYSRPGYGRSKPGAAAYPFAPNYLEREGREVLPAVLEAAGIDSLNDRPIVVGHSDGGTIALHYAAAYPERTRGAVVIAPHVFGHGVNFDLISLLKSEYADSKLQRYLAPLHDDADEVFWRWSNRWSSPEFRKWDISAQIESISAPVLAIQGRQDQYSTLDQLHEISRRLPQAELMILEDCRHTPHLEYPDKLAERIAAFLKRTKAASLS